MYFQRDYESGSHINAKYVIAPSAKSAIWNDMPRSMQLFEGFTNVICAPDGSVGKIIWIDTNDTPMVIMLLPFLRFLLHLHVREHNTKKQKSLMIFHKVPYFFKITLSMGNNNNERPISLHALCNSIFTSTHLVVMIQN